MRALVFEPTVPRYVFTKALGAVHSAAFTSPISPLALREIPPPPLPGPDWVRVRTRLGGICGTDLHVIRLETSPVLSAFTSFPFVLGHENVGTIEEAGPEAGLAPGQRVVVEPVLPCATRGVEPCRFCAAGDYHLCERTTDGRIAPGLLIGGCRDTGGSWGEFFVAHRSQVFPVPDGVSDENALLAEPMASSLHPLLRHPPPSDGTVLVIGAGVIGQLLVAAVRAMGMRARVVVLAKYPFQAEMAQRLGADHAILLGRRDEHYDALAALLGGSLLRPMLGKRVIVGGADWTAECVGSARAVDDALRLTRPGGTVVPLGLPSLPRGVDWTPLWLKELRVVGSYAYAREPGSGRRTMEIVLDWMASGRVDVRSLLTHTFPLEAFRQALATAAGKARTAAFKVAFRFTNR